MKKELLIKGEALQASVASALAAEQFLNEHYLFRRNKLNGKVEFSTKPAEGQEPVFRPLTQEALNSIILRAKREDICEGANPKTDIVEFIHSEENQHRTAEFSLHLVAILCGSLVADGHLARQ